MAETIKGINIKLSLDGKDLDNEIKAINKDLKEQQRDLRAINTNLRYDSSNVELWRKKQGQLNEMLASTKTRLDKQNQALEKAKQGLKLGTVSEAEFKKIQRNVSYSEADIKRLNNELTKTKDKIKDLGNVKFDNLAKVGGTLTKGLTIPILGAVAALTVLAKKGANTANELSSTAKRIGMSVEALQEWNHVANMAGTETKVLEDVFGKVNNILGSIALGDVKSFAGIFHALGISMDELEGKDTSEAFEIIRNALANVEDESLRLALANKLFGDKVGSELLPMLNLESDAIEELRQNAKDLGLITTEQTEVTGEFENSLKNLKTAANNLSVELAVALVPAMTSVVNIIKDKLIPIVSNMISWWTNLSEGSKKLIVTLVAVAAAIGPILSIVGKVGPLIKGVSIALKAVGAAGTIAGIGINAATLGIGALVAIVVMALMKSEKFKELLGKLMETFVKLLDPIIDIVDVLMTALQPILDIIVNIFMKLVDILLPILDMILAPMIRQLEFLGNIFSMIAPLIETVGNVLQSVLVPAFKVLDKVLQPIFKVLEKIIGFFQKLFDFAGKVGDVVGGALGAVGEKISGVVSGIGDFVGNVTGKVSDFVGGTVGKIGEFASGAVNGIKDATKGIVDGVSNFAGNVKDKASGVLNKVGGWFSDKLNLKKTSNSNNRSVSNATTNNSVTINTTSSKFDIDSINKALGGKYI